MADKQAIASQLKAVHKAFEDDRRADMASRGIDPERIEATLEKLNGNVLGLSVMLDGVDLPGLVSVTDILADPDKFDGEKFSTLSKAGNMATRPRSFLPRA